MRSRSCSSNTSAPSTCRLASAGGLTSSSTALPGGNHHRGARHRHLTAGPARGLGPAHGGRNRRHLGILGILRRRRLTGRAGEECKTEHARANAERQSALHTGLVRKWWAGLSGGGFVRRENQWQDLGEHRSAIGRSEVTWLTTARTRCSASSVHLDPARTSTVGIARPEHASGRRDHPRTRESRRRQREGRARGTGPASRVRREADAARRSWPRRFGRPSTRESRGC